MTPLNSPPYFLLFAHNLLQSVHLVFPFSSLSSSGTRATWTFVASGVSVLQNRALPKKKHDLHCGFFNHDSVLTTAGEPLVEEDFVVNAY